MVARRTTTPATTATVRPGDRPATPASCLSRGAERFSHADLAAEVGELTQVVFHGASVACLPLSFEVDLDKLDERDLPVHAVPRRQLIHTGGQRIWRPGAVKLEQISFQLYAIRIRESDKHVR